MKIDDMPIGTKAISDTGGYWIRTKRGWKWCTGDTFPRPGAGVIKYELPKKKTL